MIEMGSTSKVIKLRLNSVYLCVFEDNLKFWWIVIGRKSDGIVWVSKLHNFWEVADVDTKNDILIAPILLKPLLVQVQGNKSNMRGIHGLNRNAYTLYNSTYLCNLPYGETLMLTSVTRFLMASTIFLKMWHSVSLAANILF